MTDTESVSGLIKNIYTFANILNQAATDAAQKWNQQSINNAFNWARYCQKVFIQVKGKGFEEELNQQIKRLTLHLTPPSCLMLDLHSLEHATQLLLMVLMRNPHISSHLLQNAITSKTQDRENFIQLCKTQTEDVNSVNVANEILGMLLVTSHDQSHVSLVTQATMLLKSLLHLCQDCLKPERFERYLNSLLQRMSGMKYGLGCTVALLVSGMELVNSDSEGIAMRQIHGIVLRWLTDRLQLEIQGIPLSLLREASEYHDEFLNIYLHVLTKWIDQMQRVYEEDCRPLSLYKWRNMSSHSAMGFEELCSHFSSFLTCPTRVKQAVISMLKDGEGSSHFNIYKDIIRKIRLGKKSHS